MPEKIRHEQISFFPPPAREYLHTPLPRADYDRAMPHDQHTPPAPMSRDNSPL